MVGSEVLDEGGLAVDVEGRAAVFGGAEAQRGAGARFGGQVGGLVPFEAFVEGADAGCPGGDVEDQVAQFVEARPIVFRECLETRGDRWVIEGMAHC